MGGLPALLINQSGGADGKFGSGTEKALQAAGYPTKISEETYKKITTATAAIKADPTTSNVGYKAVSDTLLPAPLYASIKKGLLNEYSGDKYITSIPDNTAVGSFVQQQGSMMLFRQSINGKIYQFWISKNDVELLPASLFDQKMSAFGINQMSADTTKRILAYFA